MQEKTLEEEFNEKFPDPLYAVKSFGTEDYKYVYEEILSFISSREDKAREEGRKEVTSKLGGAILEGRLGNREEIITQYKEELKRKLPKQRNDHDNFDVKAVGFNECLSIIKKIIN